MSFETVTCQCFPPCLRPRVDTPVAVLVRVREDQHRRAGRDIRGDIAYASSSSVKPD